VVLGDKNARLVTELMVWAFYLTITFAVAKGWLPTLAINRAVLNPRAGRFIHTLHGPVPASPAVAFEMAKDVIPGRSQGEVQPRVAEGGLSAVAAVVRRVGVWWVRVAGSWFVAGLFGRRDLS